MTAVGLLVPEANKLTLGRSPTVLTSHDIGGILSSDGNLWLTDSHILKYQALLQEGPEIEEKPLHSCEDVLMGTHAARPDSSDHPVENPNLMLYTR